MTSAHQSFETIEHTPGRPVAGAAGCCDLPPSLRLSAAEAERLSSLFKALGNPVRVQIVDLLSRYGGQVCVCDIESQFTLSQPTISHHLKILREAGLVRAEQRGLWSFYTLRAEMLAPLAALLGSLREPAEFSPAQQP